MANVNQKELLSRGGKS